MLSAVEFVCLIRIYILEVAVEWLKKNNEKK